MKKRHVNFCYWILIVWMIPLW